MHIKTKISQHRRDFRAIYLCGHCGHEQEGDGYDDAHFHQQVIPTMACGECGKVGGGHTTAPDVAAGVVI